ncbi:related to YPT7-GTP-binding protein of the RAB family [Sporisorium reilianum f. sp. reilianum]|uniref:Related to YPT7-GTP-binding protein of the RAB family n=1 Tax=Sporisorium reilianum f. sp. reilianum TaxID=72559 RepID=A0A2N8UGH1_9BASI|nr:related to YPT7-GTP-binding protein of the RAB family [Sporisorium reilianum f. sp. reilianum]
MTSNTRTQPNGGASTSTTPKRTPSQPATLQRLRSGGEAASTLQSSAVAAMGSVRTLASVSSCGTSLHALAPQRTIKVVLIGDGGSGKTSIRNRFLTRTFFPSYRATIGADFVTRTLPLDPAHPDGAKATLQIWDTAGQERFQSLGSAFYRGADAVVIAFDASKGAEALERVKGWYEAFMAKAPGPSGEEHGRFCWVCAANKADLGTGVGAERDDVWKVLDALVARREGQPDWGADDDVAQPGDEQPANPAEVLSRPDPNGVDLTEARTPPSTSKAAREISTTSTSNADAASPTRAARPTQYRRSRQSLSSIAAAAAKSAANDANDANGGAVKTMYTTPYSTLNTHKLSSSPQPLERKADSSGFLSSWRRSKSKQSSQARGHQKRQSIKSIDVFQPSDESDTDAAARYVFPSSSRLKLDTPPRSVASARDRQRVDSSLSLTAPSVYHTPRGSTFFSVSPSVARSGDDASVRRLRVDSASSLEADSSKLNRTSIASTLSASTLKPTRLQTPKSITDLFHPQPSSPPAPHTPSTISLPLPPPLPLPPTATSPSIEHGFTLFATSAKSAHNIERMFAHIVQRVGAASAFDDAQRAVGESDAQRREREEREAELVRRTIRLASGKGTGERWFACC